MNKTGGWSDLDGQARKFHYFESNQSGTKALCGKWAIMQSHQLQPHTGMFGPADCMACTKKLSKLQETS